MRAPSGISLAREPVRVPGAVPALVMVADDRAGRREQVEWREQRVADLRVRLDDRALLLVERPRLEQDTVGDADLADVVEDRSQADRLDLVRPQPQQLGDADGQRGEPLAVAVEVESRASIALARALASVGVSSRSRISSRRLFARSRASATAVWRSAWANGLVTRPGRAARQRLAERLVGAGARDEDDGKRGPAALHRLEQFEARETGHDHVAHDEVEVGGRRAAPARARRFRHRSRRDRQSRVSPRSGCGSPPRRRSRGCGSSRLPPRRSGAEA